MIEKSRGARDESLGFLFSCHSNTLSRYFTLFIFTITLLHVQCKLL